MSFAQMTRSESVERLQCALSQYVTQYRCVFAILMIGLCFSLVLCGTANAHQPTSKQGSKQEFATELTQFDDEAVALIAADAPVSKASLASRWAKVLLLRDYNTRVVLLGTLLLGTMAGVVGVFVLLRKRSLVGDVIGHASLPGVAVAFLVMEVISPGEGRYLPGLLFGATIAGLAGVLVMTGILRFTRIKEDAALAIVLSSFFGMGMVLFTIIQRLPTGSSAGLTRFIFGSAALMLAEDVILITQGTIVVLIACALLFKELNLLCFDEGFASSQGWPTAWLDLLLMGLVVAVTEIGAESVGLILVVALMIIPASAARFWSDNLMRMTIIAASVGGISALLGTVFSAVFRELAAGATIVLFGGLLFLLSMIFGTKRGVFWRLQNHLRLKRRVGRHDLMRTFYETLEAGTEHKANGELPDRVVQVHELAARRAWSPARLRRVLAAAVNDRLVVSDFDGGYRLTRGGRAEAFRAARNHRLWELYLIEYADIAPSQVDRDADRIEHILGSETLFELERLLAKHYPLMEVPPSPHAIDDVSASAT